MLWISFFFSFLFSFVKKINFHFLFFLISLEGRRDRGRGEGARGLLVGLGFVCQICQMRRKIHFGLFLGSIWLGAALQQPVVKSRNCRTHRRLIHFSNSQKPPGF